MFGAGAVLRGLAGADYRVTPEAVERAFMETRWGDPHHSQPAVLSLTLPTDYGTLYTLDHVRALTKVAGGRGLRVHMDGARIANAIQALGCRPAEITWRSGVDLLTLGATKNGAMSTDAIVSFDPAISQQLVYRTKRAGHVASKMRFQSVQLDAYLTDDLWLKLAGQANSAMRRLAAGLRQRQIEFLNEPEVNILFIRLAPERIERLAASGVLFYRMAPDVIRLVTSFETTLGEIDEVLSRLDSVG
jgi:threonine aldolase